MLVAIECLKITIVINILAIFFINWKQSKSKYTYCNKYRCWLCTRYRKIRWAFAYTWRWFARWYRTKFDCEKSSRMAPKERFPSELNGLSWWIRNSLEQLLERTWSFPKRLRKHSLEATFMKKVHRRINFGMWFNCRKSLTYQNRLVCRSTIVLHYLDSGWRNWSYKRVVKHSARIACRKLEILLKRWSWEYSYLWLLA